MSKNPFAIESREKITRSTINKSTSKTLWSFNKNKRFSEQKPSCPYVSYLHNLSTNSQRKTGFGTQKRKVFTQVSDTPPANTYYPQPDKLTQIPIFALSRQNCVANSYISIHPEQVPGPGRYEQHSESKKKGYSMRPKTATNRTYFIDNKQLRSIPSPFQYQHIDHSIGKEAVSKYRSVTLGSSGMQSKNERFKEFNDQTPSPFVYNPKKYGVNKFTRGGKIGRCNRLSFIDKAAKTSYTPGPGHYEAPTQFAHYSSNSIL